MHEGKSLYIICSDNAFLKKIVEQLFGGKIKKNLKFLKNFKN
jgi:hypothetical protein